MILVVKKIRQPFIFGRFCRFHFFSLIFSKTHCSLQELCEKRMKKLEVFFTEEDLSFETIFFERGLEGMRGIFKRYDFDKYDRLETFLKRLGEKQIIFRPASL